MLAIQSRRDYLPVARQFQNHNRHAVGMALLLCAFCMKACFLRNFHKVNPPFIWFVSFGQAKEMNIIMTACKPKGIFKILFLNYPGFQAGGAKAG
jgi:hypothetical protein